MKTALIRILIQLKNASILNKKSICLRINSQHLTILEILYREGLIQSIRFDVSFLRYIIFLRFYEQQRLIQTLKFFSVPSQTSVIPFRELVFINDKNLFLLLSTDKGLLTLSQCKKLKVGGKLLFCIL